jgi:prophage regulatory protein
VGKKQFPKPVKLGLRSTAWVESEVQEWIEVRTAESRGEERKKRLPQGHGVRGQR